MLPDEKTRSGTLQHHQQTLNQTHPTEQQSKSATGPDVADGSQSGTRFTKNLTTNSGGETYKDELGKIV